MTEALFTATIDGVCVTVYPGLVECTANAWMSRTTGLGALTA